MNKIHLSPAQQALCDEFKQSADRPSFEQYEVFQKRMEVIDRSLPKKPKQKEIPHTKLGSGQTEVKLKSSFDALLHLPQGWAVYPTYDSGGNHGIESAGKLTLRNMWNYGWQRRSHQLGKC